MKPEQLILNEIHEMYGEWIETAGANAPLVLIDILSKLLAQERKEVEWLRSRITHSEKTRNHYLSIN